MTIAVLAGFGAAGLAGRAPDDLKQWLNAERGHARVILLLSST